MVEADEFRRVLIIELVEADEPASMHGGLEEGCQVSLHARLNIGSDMFGSRKKEYACTCTHTHTYV